MEGMKKIRAVLFDYGMVLSGAPDAAEWERMRVLLEADAERFHAAYWKFRDAYDRGALSGAEYWQAVASEVGRKLDAATLALLIEADTAHWTRPNEPMIAWATALQKAGVKTGILSNIGDAMEDGIRGRFAWLDEFAHHTFSHRLGIAKPDAAIYHHAAQGLGVAEEEILFIDDREENIAAARSVGMTALQYSDHVAFVAAMRDAGLTSLLDIDT